MTITLPDYVRDDIQRNVSFALEEDIRSGDITAQLIDADSESTATIITRENAVMCGIPWADEVFRQLGDVQIEWHVEDGDRLTADTTLCTLRGNTRQILTGERTALNFLQTLMGTATTARRYADAVAGTTVTILDTRKTLPGLRAGQKYAVLCGGCQNHRVGLYDAFLIKENHVAACGGITAAIERARALAPEKKIIVEVETLAELKEAAALKPDQIMLDNFSARMLKEAASVTTESALEVSGNLTVENAKALPHNHEWFLSSGALTKHIHATDLSLRLQS
ncbi:nicotinate-nucleotide diphosphorylase (carboxylating) [Alcanivorax sp. HI0033]|uniref:carboxylating nicotinate-nucleotide diphosphorylase n=1 Tax=unclassified Alcanivorax TaxID=2638842 RepID=UPI0007BA6DAC|nr:MULTISPECIES: carboxylating nicotinate-nucleotide diphosphorylase [unclassified Alcanivorax]KZX74792.1 nicotinate-nucleotide diphosphorylase (carboxylating) [Alcanivorax sp. HI0011]KZX83538.1 nicotinate-nucleotide diphosphorylase (carboxylating) [Alcanivorax sp. HI0013]KZY12315.1 nicotinate-nucleotide diphosphorylase (carboxylating) [Alcanivorax sp. HI0035]KZX68185.1 nicotinate-nucleotide diphosphorylase (carboxylating) [Alcanivorax sp. HI0003]KZX70105.1 nicotinate-nucleotide diphosphorylas